jgi:hypothetical protein
MPIYLALVIKGVPPLERLSQHSKPTPKGAPFYIASRYRTSAFGLISLPR